MSNSVAKVIRPVKVLVMAGLLGWGLIAWWTIRQARQTGSVLRDALTATWPEQGSPRFGTREKLLQAAEDIRAGAFGSVVFDLGPTRPPTAEQKIAAQRFFAQSQPLRQRFIAAASGARILEDAGAEVSVVRDALARALSAAANNDEDRVNTYIKLAERALEEIDTLGEAGAAPGDAETVAALVRQIGPAFNLGRELMTEGNASVEKLVRRASWHAEQKEYRQAASLLRVAAALLGVEASAPAAAVTPQWFDELAQSPPPAAAESGPQEVVELCEAMAASLSPSKAVTALVEKARRQLDAGRPGEAHWWASVALGTMGMTDEAIAAATKPAETEGP